MYYHSVMFSLLYDGEGRSKKKSKVSSYNKISRFQT